MAAVGSNHECVALFRSHLLTLTAGRDLGHTGAGEDNGIDHNRN
jgi:hypothetical protein